MCHNRQVIQWTVCLLAVAAIAGCGEPGRGGLRVAGSVTLDGQPMPAGSVVFVPTGKGHKAAGEIVAGEFVIDESDGPIPGQYRVEVYASESSDVPLDDPLAYARSAPHVPPPNPVAARFNTQSTLRETVAADGENSFSFQVESHKSQQR